MHETVHIPIKMPSSKAHEHLDDINLILRNTGEKEITAKELKGTGDFKLNYKFSANYIGDLPVTLKAVKRLADNHGARSVTQVKMFLLDVLRALEAI